MKLLRPKLGAVACLALAVLSLYTGCRRNVHIASPADDAPLARQVDSEHTSKAKSQLPQSSNGRRTDKASTRAINFAPFNDTGVILFYHLAKTGGKTIRDNFGKLDNVEFVRAWNKTQFASLSEEMDSIMDRKLTKILFVEMHSGDALPGLFDLHPLMKKWHRQSRENGVPFFAFTLLRNPINIHVSAFLFFHLRRCGAPWCSWRRYYPTQKNLVKSVTPNRQCLSLAKGQDHPDRQNATTPVSATECQDVEYLLRREWNWVGTTEEMNDTTLPLLFRMLNRTEAIKNVTYSNIRKFRPKDPSNVIKASNLTMKTKQALKNKSQLDFKLYEAFKRGSIHVEPRKRLERS